MRFHNMLTNRQANAAATTSPRTGFVYPVKPFKNVLPLLGRQPNARILHDNAHLRVICLGLDRHLFP
jgi:hypothetical protein